MPTEFNDRAAGDRPLNDRLSDVPPKDAVSEDNRATDDAVPDRAASGKAVPGKTATKDRTRFEEPESRVDTEPKSRTDVRPEPVTDELPAQERTSGHAKSVVPQQENRASLFEAQEAERFRMEWREVQSSFVDEPKTAVREADSLLAKMMDELKTRIESHRGDLGNGDTEEMRLAMQRYRSLFDQILSV